MSCKNEFSGLKMNMLQNSIQMTSWCMSRMHVTDSADEKFWTMTFEAGPKEVETHVVSEIHIEDIWVVLYEAKMN